MVLSDRKYAIGVDLGGQSVKLAIVDDAGQIWFRRQAPIDPQDSADRLALFIIEEIQAIQVEAENQGKSCVRIGMVMPGYMDSSRNRILFSANLPTLNGSDFPAAIKRNVTLPIVFDADSNGAALGEYYFGAGRGSERLIVATVGTGIGAGVILAGKLLRTYNHTAGSLGHVIVNAKGPTCPCGGRGCLEALASGRALERRAAELAQGNPGSRLAALLAERGRLTGVEIGIALKENDPPACQAVQECGWWLGVGVASWSVIFRPETVVITGGVAELGEPLLTAAREGLAEVGQPAATAIVTIIGATLGTDAGIIGAATAAFMAQNDHNRTPK